MKDRDARPIQDSVTEIEGGNVQLIDKLVQLYVPVFKRPPWNLDVNEPETKMEYEEDLANPKLRTLLSYYNEDNKILAYTLGIVGTPDVLITHINTILVNAKYFGKLLTENTATQKLDEFWKITSPYLNTDKELIYVYDTLKDEENKEVSKLSHEWLKTVVNVGEKAIGQGVTQLVGFTLNDGDMNKILATSRVITHTEEIDYPPNRGKGSLIFCNDLPRLIRICNIAMKMSAK